LTAISALPAQFAKNIIPINVKSTAEVAAYLRSKKNYKKSLPVRSLCCIVSCVVLQQLVMLQIEFPRKCERVGKMNVLAKQRLYVRVGDTEPETGHFSMQSFFV